jgi:hypothetical protein
MALLKFKRSAVPAKVPSIADLDLGELAINTYDGKVYTKKDDGTQAIVEVGGGGGVQTIASADGSVTVTGTTDIDLSVAVAAATTTIILPVRNNTGATLAKGTAVYINGALGQNPTVTKAIATGDATSAQTLGLMTANLSNNSVGNVTLIGTLTNLDTSAYSDGQQLYLSPTTAGALTATKPYAPNHLVYMAVVEHAHPSLGKLFVKVQNGYEMDELHDVSAQNPANNDGLFYNTTSGLWEKKSIATALGYTPANKAGDTFTGVVSIYNSNDAQLYLNGNGTSWAGISWADVSGTDYIWYNGSTSTFAIGGGGSFVANKKLHVHGGMTIGSGLAMSASGTNSLLVEETITANQIYSQIFYDSQNGAYYVDPAASSNLYSATVNSVLVLPAAAGTNSFFVGTGDGASLSTYNFGLSGWNGMAFYNPTSGGAFPNATTGFLAFRDGFIEMRGSLRAPIFYDSDNTAYYINGAGNSVLNTLYMRNGSIEAKFAQASQFGYSPSYKTIVLGNEYLTTISMGVDVSGNASGSFNGQGEGREVLFRNGVTFITPNSANNGYLPTFNMTDGYVTSGGSVRSPIFYDSDNTGYYLDPASTSVLGGIVLNGTLDVRDGNVQFWRSTNGAYQRVDTRTEATSLSRAHWYGVNSSGGTSNFRHAWYDNAAYFNVTAQDGEIIFERTAGETIVRSTGSFRAPIFYDSNNTGFFVDPAGTSAVTNLLLADNGSIQFNDRGRDANTVTNPQWSFRSVRWDFVGAGSVGTGGNYAGLMTFVPWVGTTASTGDASYQMAWGSTGANGTGVPHLRIRKGIDATWNSFYTIHHDGFDQPMYAASSFRAPIFYDSDDTGYYVDGNGNTRLNQLLLTGSIATINNYSPANSAIRLTPNLHLNATAGNAVILNWDNGTTSGQTLRIGNGAGTDVFNVYANGATYAPIMYDISDSAYYVDPNNTSRLNVLQVNGSLSPDGAKLSVIRTNDGSTALYVGTGSQGVYVKNDPANATTVQYFSSGAAGGSHRFLSGNTPALFITGDYAEGAGSLRAPIFYDTNNTGYYFDGSATSRWATSNQDGFHTFNNYGLGIVGLYASTRYQLVWALGNDYKGNADGTSVAGGYGLWFSHPNAGGVASNLSTHGLMLIQNGAFMASLDPSMRAIYDMRSPIFYDLNNTAYFLDPNSTSVLATVRSDRIQHSNGNEAVTLNNGSYLMLRDPTGHIAAYLGGADPANYHDNTTHYFRDRAGSNRFVIDSSGNVTATGNVTAYSDIRIKANVETIPSALDKLDQIRGVTYTRTDLDDKEQRYAGVIAQEIEAVLPEAVRDLGNIKAVDYNATIALLIQAVKELRDEVEALRK